MEACEAEEGMQRTTMLFVVCKEAKKVLQFSDRLSVDISLSGLCDPHAIKMLPKMERKLETETEDKWEKETKLRLWQWGTPYCQKAR